jgi:uncharacterized protein DUF732
VACPYCGSDVGGTGVCRRCGSVRGADAWTGWKPDPTGRHEGRYFVTGRPTNRVRNGRAQATDSTGGQLLPGYLEVAAPGRHSVRSSWLGTAAMTTIVVVAAVMVWVLQHPHQQPATSPETNYLSVLRDAGWAGDFTSDADAVAHGRQVCAKLQAGGPQQGLPADKIAVDQFCPQFSDGFHVLETATVAGTFVLVDAVARTGVNSIVMKGTSCEGTDGFSDIGQDTQLVVKSGTGETLATTTLGQGHSSQGMCTYSFTFPITEGQDRYVVSVSHRGEFTYTFDQLQRSGVHIRLGN